MTSNPSPPVPQLLVVPPRFASYLAACGSDNAAAHDLVTFNMQVSEAFSTPLYIYEVTFRNAISDALATAVGTQEWWSSATTPLYHPQDKQLQEAKRNAKKKGAAATVDHVVAELSLGFWTGLLSKRYRLRWNIHRLAFPQYVGSRQDVFRDAGLPRLWLTSNL